MYNNIFIGSCWWENFSFCTTIITIICLIFLPKMLQYLSFDGRMAANNNGNYFNEIYFNVTINIESIHFSILEYLEHQHQQLKVIFLFYLIERNNFSVLLLQTQNMNLCNISEHVFVPLSSIVTRLT